MKRQILFLLLSLVISHWSFAEVRYVSHSGSNTPPYLTWETAADSIMSAINISSFEDTIYVANGIYKERIDMIPGLKLIGAGMDSCIIDSRDFTYVSGFYTVRVSDSCSLSGFRIITYDISHGSGIYILDWDIQITNVVIEYNKITQTFYGIDVTTSSLGFDNGNKLIKRNILTDVFNGIRCSQTSPLISENIIYAKGFGLASAILSAPIYLNNVVTMEDATNTSHGFGSGFNLGSLVKNNLFISLDNSGDTGMHSYSDSLINNIVYGEWNYGVFTANSNIRNNHIQNTNTGMCYDVGGGQNPIFQYNNLWKNQTNYQSFIADSTNIYSDPMFINLDSLDFHLQKYSPLIDAGDPTIFDIDSSRSDIGLYGGPYGESYKYLDLPPRTPVNFTAILDTNDILLTWNSNTEADFSHYNLYRDTVQGFTIDSTTFIASIADTFYLHIIPPGIDNLYFKVIAIDNQGNQSDPSEELQVLLTGINNNKQITISNYQLYQNYPNPFNPTTKIGYRLKERGYVKLYVYDIKGELVETLVNKYQEGGYYEVDFNAAKTKLSSASNLASGIYIYQLMVRSEENIPVFTDIKKMIYLK